MQAIREATRRAGSTSTAPRSPRPFDKHLRPADRRPGLSRQRTLPTHCGPPVVWTSQAPTSSNSSRRSTTRLSSLKYNGRGIDVNVAVFRHCSKISAEHVHASTSSSRTSTAVRTTSTASTPITQTCRPKPAHALARRVPASSRKASSSNCSRGRCRTSISISARLMSIRSTARIWSVPAVVR